MAKLVKRKITDYLPNPLNHNLGSERGSGMIEQSFRTYGAGRSLLVDKNGVLIAGNQSQQGALNAGIEDVIEVETDGKTLVVVKRNDLDLTTDARAVELGYMDNRTNEVSYTLDTDQLAADIASGADFSLMYSHKELDALIGGIADTSQESFDDLLSQPTLSKSDVPDAIFPTDNDYGIPVLMSELQADALDAPVSTWRETHYTGKSGGTVLFYLDDSRFNALWSDPTPLVKAQPITIVEPNFSMNVIAPRVYCLWQIYRKRWLARCWQGFGIRVFVDLNVSGDAPDQYADNLLGVPKGWKAYATRAHSEQHDAVEREFAIACEHSGVSRPLFAVYGGGKAMQARCKQREWLWIPEPSKFSKEWHYGRQQE